MQPDHCTGHTNPNNTVEIMGQPCPDEASRVVAEAYDALRAAGQYVRPRDLRRLYSHSPTFAGVVPSPGRCPPTRWPNV